MSDEKDLIDIFAELFAGLYKKNDKNNMIGGQPDPYDINDFAKFDSLHDFHSIRTELNKKGVSLMPGTESLIHKIILENFKTNQNINDTDRDINQNYKKIPPLVPKMIPN